MKLVVVTQWGRTGEVQVPPDQRLARRSETNRHAPQDWGVWSRV